MEISRFLNNFLSQIVFVKSVLLSLILSGASVAYVVYKSVGEKMSGANTTVALIILVLVMGIIVSKTPSDAYLPSLFVPIVFAIAIFLGRLSKTKKLLIFLCTLVIFLNIVNAYLLISNKYFLDKGRGISIKQRIDAVKYMIENSGGRSFQIVGVGKGSQFQSYIMNYEYLAWYYGKEAKENAKIKFVISESLKGLSVFKRD
jgi:hypothetical protein